MATSVLAPRRSRIQPDRIFFPAMCLLILVTVWLGFAKTYYGIGLLRAPLPNTLIHVHAVVFSLWLLTLIVQTALVTARKVKLHMTLGLWGFGLAAAMVVLGCVAARDSLHRGMAPPWSGLSPETFFVIPFSDMAIFAVLAGWAYAVRRKPDAHKRLILIATLSLLDAAIGRFPATIAPMPPAVQIAIMFGLLAIVAVYDLATRRAVHRVTWMGSLLILVIEIVRVPLAATAPWQAFAHSLRG